MPLHDQAKVAGVSESCRYNDHNDCRAPGCSCTCHRPSPNPNIPSPSPTEAAPEKACPKCGVRRPFIEEYCRIDGERLASLLCGMCGKGMDPADSYCWQCGAPKGSATSQPKVVVTVPAPESGEVDYGNQVLRAIQEELSVTRGDNGNLESKDAKVVEQPGGTQGSFKIVSAPNPNKLRTPGGLKLPIKPS